MYDYFGNKFTGKKYYTSRPKLINGECKDE